MSDITTPVASSTKANIALLYGSALANDLIELPKVVLKPEEKFQLGEERGLDYFHQ
jgi:hypothetical protein